MPGINEVISAIGTKTQPWLRVVAALNQPTACSPTRLPSMI